MTRWPATLWIVRHGQSAGNVARDEATSANLARIDIGGRDADVPLSPLGQDQAAALGSWFAAMPANQRPQVLLASPYRRARQTAEIFRATGGTPSVDTLICIDERLREKEFGILDGLTPAGVRQFHPEQATFRTILGKFYHRAPGGESWCDVILRLRSVLDTISLHHADQRVMIVAHQVVVLCLRYVLEGMKEEDILAVDKAGDVANCSITEYRHAAQPALSGSMELVRYNVTAPVRKAGMPVTHEPDANVGVR